MPDSQNKQGEQAVDLTKTFGADIWAKEWLKTIKENPSIPTDEGCMISWFANAIMAGYDHANRQSLLSQQHAPSKEAGDRLGSLQRFDWSYHSGVFHSSEGELVELSEVETLVLELATELTKRREEERVKHEAQLKAVKEDRDAILDDRDSLRQQLAEANERVLLFEKLSVERGREIETIRAQNIALSAVVDKTRAAIAAWDGSGAGPACRVLHQIQSILYPDLDMSLYGRIVEYLRGGYHVYASVEASELLTALGQPKPWKS